MDICVGGPRLPRRLEMTICRVTGAAGNHANIETAAWRFAGIMRRRQRSAWRRAKVDDEVVLGDRRECCW